MDSILVLAHTALNGEGSPESGSTLTRASLEAVSAGRELATQLSVPLTIGVMGADSALAAASAWLPGSALAGRFR